MFPYFYVETAGITLFYSLVGQQQCLNLTGRVESKVCSATNILIGQ